jgi:hypothetical protein
MKKKSVAALRQVKIQIDGHRVVAWEAKEPTMHTLGRWTDPKGLLQRIHEIEHPEEAAADGPGRQWQATWRGRFAPNSRGRTRKAA